MGLDMYLSAKRFLHYDEGNLEKRVAKAFPDAPGEPIQLEVEVLYWRKANQIHAWFVKNVQGGKDDCGEYDVGREQLLTLRQVVGAVLENHDQAPTLLPAKGGFFFGDTGYGEGYYEDLQHTYEKLSALLVSDRIQSLERWDFYYRASW